MDDISSQPFKILAVDDSAVSRKLVEHSLSEQRYNVLFAKDGREAPSLFKKHQPARQGFQEIGPQLNDAKVCFINPDNSLIEYWNPLSFKHNLSR